MSEPYLRIAVVGATGLVGRKMVGLLEQRRLPIRELRLMGSDRAQSRSIPFRGQEIAVEPARPARLADVDLVLSSAGGAVSRDLLPAAAEAGAVCIDNTSAFRLDPEVPLVVPEVNGHRLDEVRLGDGGAIIANPNCSTIQLVAALKPLHDVAGVRKVVVSTYQSVSGAGREELDRFGGASQALLNGTDDLHESLRGTAAFDTLPVIGDLEDDGCSTEERKMMLETPKILEADVAVDVTCVRVPVVTGHAESVVVELERPLSLTEARAALSSASGIVLSDGSDHPTPRTVAGEHPVHVGRVRRARCVANGLQMWVVADNILKGAALNAVQIAERLIEQSAAASPAAERAAGLHLTSA